MLDLSEEFDEENISTCVAYFQKMAPLKIWLEMEIGITGGEEDGVDNTNVKAESLYTKSEQVCSRNHDNYYNFLMKIGIKERISYSNDNCRQKNISIPVLRFPKSSKGLLN